MTITANQVQVELEKWVGWAESPGSEVIPFQAKWGYPTSMVVEWCGGLICECVDLAGGSVGPGAGDTIPNTWYTPSGVAGFQALGRWHTTPEYGDLVYFDWNGSGLGGPAGAVDHVGFVIDASKWGSEGVITTIEGNVSERCGKFRRYLSQGVIVGFGRPNYTAPSIPTGGFAVSGAIAARWNALGGAGGILGAPKGPEQQFGQFASIRWQPFNGGNIFWSAATGAWEMYGAIFQRWWGGAGNIGLPTGGEENGPYPGSRWQRFQNGRIYWHTTTGARVIKGDILAHYEALSQANKVALGPLVSDEKDGKVSLFQNGQIAWEPVRKAWNSL